MKPIGVMGGGSWGTALAVQFSRTGHEVRLWVRRQEHAEELARRRLNEVYLPEVELPESLHPTAELSALDDCDLVLVVVPSHGFRPVVQSFLEQRPANRPVTLISATKGIEAETSARMSEVCFEEAIHADREVLFGVLSGPTFAAELAQGLPAAGVVASDDVDLAESLQNQLSAKNYRLYSSTDVVGVELGGATKNVIAIAAGAVAGLGLGHNTLAALITRGLHEITRLGLACGGRARTFSGLAGLGDLVLTCTGGLSRNRRTGFELARGRTLEEITSGTSMVAEGIRNARSVSQLAHQKGVEMPIIEQMVKVLYEGVPPREAVEPLMTRELKSEAAL
ncbi:MAG: NAD(P)-dependent glycerol-3-phosphate dehydrogenase [Acidobacteria bacterium]|nr:NAD(P)-dependent glycerol-3-phosphate dehydrogenase [Acidobacteriota bacterium]